MYITKDKLQKIIAEEYVRSVLESNGHKITEKRIAFLVEKLENGELDEGFFSKLGSAVGAAKKAWKEKGEEEKTEKQTKQSEKLRDFALKATDQISKKLKDLRSDVVKKLQDSGISGMIDAPETAETMIVHALVKRHPDIASDLKTHIKDETMLRNVMSDTPFGAAQRSRFGGSLSGTGKSGGVAAAVKASTGGTGTNESLRLIQDIISEEYARIILKKSGHKITEARVKHLAKKMKSSRINEGLLDKISAKVSGGEGYLRKLQDDVIKKVSDIYSEFSKKLGEDFDVKTFNGFFVSALTQLDPSKFMPKSNIVVDYEKPKGSTETQVLSGTERTKALTARAFDSLKKKDINSANAFVSQLIRIIKSDESNKDRFLRLINQEINRITGDSGDVTEALIANDLIEMITDRLKYL